jgi:Caspase domain
LINADQLQIRDLKAVLESRFHFTVLEQSLNPITDKKKSAQKLLQKCLADFVDKEDEKDSLLIVYYAGHGNPGSGGELMLTG